MYKDWVWFLGTRSGSFVTPLLAPWGASVAGGSRLSCLEVCMSHPYSSDLCWRLSKLCGDWRKRPSGHPGGPFLFGHPILSVGGLSLRWRLQLFLLHLSDCLVDTHGFRGLCRNSFMRAEALKAVGVCFFRGWRR